MICDKAGINVNELITLASKHPRVKILKPGPGVGGHCIAVDPWFIVADFQDEAKIIRQARMTNTYKRDWVIEKIKLAAATFRKKNKKVPVIACMGLAYKPNIDDLRESPALEITHELQRLKYNVLAVEPNVARHGKLVLTDPAAEVKGADILVFLVAHRAFEKLTIPKEKVILDFCGVAN
jgi:UDP-N-acetyl-D-mannosaminuronic acid dehydrogenase